MLWAVWVDLKTESIYDKHAVFFKHFMNEYHSGINWNLPDTVKESMCVKEDLDLHWSLVLLGS